MLIDIDVQHPVNQVPGATPEKGKERKRKRKTPVDAGDGG